MNRRHKPPPRRQADKLGRASKPGKRATGVNSLRVASKTGRGCSLWLPDRRGNICGESYWAVIGLWPGAVLAAEQPSFQPPSPWVRPAAPPPSPTDVDKSAGRVLLFDEQAHFGAEGVSIYTETVAQLQTPQGVMAAGSVTLAWRPDTDQIVIHKVRILRGAETIDVLAKQRFSVIRRETNLEMAEVDGVLTATLQPEDLRGGRQAGCRLDADSQETPCWAGGRRSTLGAPNVAVDDLRLHAVADPGVHLNWRATEDLPKTKLASVEGGEALAFEMKKAEPLSVPADAPVRFRLSRRVEISEFRAWADVSALMAPLYAKAAALAATSPLKAEAAKIRAASKDPKAQAAAALRLVQDQIRYLALTMNDGGLEPASADLTWSRRFGDCKAKTVLLIALLNELGVAAQPALVNSQVGDGLDGRLPSVQSFDHVMVRATIGGHVYWLDGARSGDQSLDNLAVPGFSWALPVQDAGGSLVRLEVPPLDRPDSLQQLSLDASTGLDAPAKAHAEITLRGDGAFALNAQFSDMSPSQTDVALKAYWKKTYDFIEPKTVSVRFDPQAGEERLTMDGSAAMAWTTPSDGAGRRYETDGYQVGWKPNWKRDPGPYSDVPIAVEFPGFTQTEETILPPRKGQGFTVEGEDVDQRVAAWMLTRKSAITDGVFAMKASVRTLSPEVPAKDLAEAAKSLRRWRRMGSICARRWVSGPRIRTWPNSPPAFRPTPTAISTAAWSFYATAAPRTPSPTSSTRRNWTRNRRSRWRTWGSPKSRSTR